MANSNTGAFLPTTILVDPSKIYATDVNSRDFKDLIVKLYQAFSSISTMTNLKDSAIYDQTEFVTGQQFFKDPALDSTTAAKPQLRQTYRKVINFGALPNANIKTVVHGITTDVNTSFTRIYGVATDPIAKMYIPLPYGCCAAKANCIELWANGTHVCIDTCTTDRSGYTKTYVVLEYMKF